MYKGTSRSVGGNGRGAPPRATGAGPDLLATGAGPDLLASDVDRETGATRLKEAFSAGRVDADEFEARADLVQRARTVGDVRKVLADLPALPVVPTPVPGAVPRGASDGPRSIPDAPAPPSSPPSTARAPLGDRLRNAWDVIRLGAMVLLMLAFIVGLIYAGAEQQRQIEAEDAAYEARLLDRSIREARTDIDTIAYAERRLLRSTRRYSEDPASLDVALPGSARALGDPNIVLRVARDVTGLTISAYPGDGTDVVALTIVMDDAGRITRRCSPASSCPAGWATDDRPATAPDAH